MARFVDMQNFSQQTANKYLEQLTTDYASFFGGLPTYVTYFSKNEEYSTKDIGLENVLEVSGSESPINFNKIENVPLYKMSEATPSTDVQEYGLDTSMESEAIIVPGTIKPMPDDLMTLPYNGENRLFKIHEVDTDRINGKLYYKISFHLSTTSRESLDDQIKDEYIYTTDSTSPSNSDRKAKVLKKNKLLADKYDQVLSALVSYYISNFFDQKLGFLTYTYNQFNIYNRYLIKFCADNEVLIRENEFMSSVHVQDYLRDLKYIDIEYENTIYHAIEKNTLNDLRYENFTLYPILRDNQAIPFYYSYKDYHNVNYDTDTRSASNYVVPHNDSLFSNIKTNTLYDDREYIIEDFVIRYFNDIQGKDFNNLSDLLMKYLEDVNEAKMPPFLNTFLMLPCLIFILKGIKEKLLS